MTLISLKVRQQSSRSLIICGTTRAEIITDPDNLVRTTRVRMIRLQNDHKEVMKYLEKGLHAHFAQLQNTQGVASTNGSSVPTTNGPASVADASTLGTPFAKVNSVEQNSPAAQAGLKAGDTIRGFGNVNWLNHQRLTKVAETVQQNEGVSDLVSKNHVHTLTLFISFSSARCVGQGREKEREWIRNRQLRFTTHPSTQLGWKGITGMSSCALVDLQYYVCTVLYLLAVAVTTGDVWSDL